MPTLLIDASRVVRYSKEVEVTEAQAAEFRRAFETEDKEEIEEALSDWLSNLDMVEAENYEAMNAMIDGEQLAM